MRDIALWIGGLAVALGGSELLVHCMTEIGRRIKLGVGLLGLLVALGADAPEITSALLAIHRGSSNIGAGIVLGSNIYNLAGLLGLTAVLGGTLSIAPHWLTRDAAVNVLLTAMAAVLLLAGSLHLFFAAGITLVCFVYVAFLAATSRLGPTVVAGEQPQSGTGRSPLWLTTLLLVAVVAIVAGSDALVTSSLSLGSRWHAPATITGTVVLAVATSLPNTWVAISLARRRLGRAAIAATFSSNSINLVAGLAIPSLVLTIRPGGSATLLDFGWLAGMTACSLIFLGARHSLSRIDGAILLLLYAAFVAARIAVPG